MPTPDPERQVQFLFNVQRLISDGSFVATYKFALLLALADLAVERGDDTTESLPLDTRDLAEKFVELYWRQVLPWVPAHAGTPGRLAQATGQATAVLNRVAAEHQQFQGSLPRLRKDKTTWSRVIRDVAQTIKMMPLWKLQTIGPDKLHFLYPNVGKGNRIELTGEAVYCLRRFRNLIGDMAESAWVRFVRRLPGNYALLGEGADLREFLFGRTPSEVSPPSITSSPGPATRSTSDTTSSLPTPAATEASSTASRPTSTSSAGAGVRLPQRPGFRPQAGNRRPAAPRAPPPQP
jgi:hypothetical protein